MFLKHLSLQNFRNYTKSSFNFTKQTTLIVGPNTSGKTNFIEAIYLLSMGKTNKDGNDENAIAFSSNLARIKGKTDTVDLEVVLANIETFRKKYLVNGVSKKRLDFMGNLSCVLFAPSDLEIVIGSPGQRRKFLDEVLSQIDRDYRFAKESFERGLRQRNALLQKAREFGGRSEKEFAYWDSLLITSGNVITKKREEFVNFINNFRKDIFDFTVTYDKSIISRERLLQYQQAEIGSGVTLVGPHRDDLVISMFDSKKAVARDVRIFGSRGQQRLVVLQLKLLQMEYMEKFLGERPTLLLDDIFSELDQGHIDLVLEMVGGQQTIMTTTHKEFIPKKISKDLSTIDLNI